MLLIISIFHRQNEQYVEVTYNQEDIDISARDVPHAIIQNNGSIMIMSKKYFWRYLNYLSVHNIRVRNLSLHGYLAPWSSFVCWLQFIVREHERMNEQWTAMYDGYRLWNPVCSSFHTDFNCQEKSYIIKHWQMYRICFWY